jgi:penicillin G amidase
VTRLTPVEDAPSPRDARLRALRLGARLAAATAIVTTLSVGVLAQDTTVADPESEGRRPRSRSSGRVVRDKDGIPHIAASSERQVLYLQGFTHAQDRLFQMDVTRRQADGTLAELLGGGALASDVQLRTFGLRRAAERSLPILSRNVRDALSAYADGVNAYVARHSLPPEYAALEITTFRPWAPVDSLSILRLITFGLSFELTDLDRTTLLAQYQTAGAARGFDGAALFFEDVNRLAPFNDAATVPDASASDSSSAVANAVENVGQASTSVMELAAASPAMNDAVLMGMARDYLAHVRSLPFVQSALKNPDDDRGSNEFVISGRHSRTGRPILANDPHLALTAPAFFYENEIRTPGFSAIGGSIPGVPFVIAGNTERFAWGVTTHFMDVTDVYQEQIVSDTNSPSGLSTVYQGRLEPVHTLPQVFRANTLGDGVQNNVVNVPPGGAIPAAILIVPRRNQGPIITFNQAAGTAISVQYAGFSGTREMQAFRSINRASTLTQFTAALQSFDVGSQNFIYADTKGNIAYYAAGEMPLREDLENGAPVGLPPFLIRDGRGGNEWLPARGHDRDRALPFAILPFTEMPQLINPPRGFIVNANNDPTGNRRDNNVLNVLRPGGGIRYLGTGYSFDLGIRAGRIEQLLAASLASGRRLGVEDLQRVQSDVVMGDATFFVPYIVRAFGNALRPGAPGELTSVASDLRIVQAVARMAVWDGSTPTGIVEGFDASDQNGKRAQPHAREITNSIAATIYSVWRNQIVNDTLTATLTRHGLTINSPRDIQLTAVKHLFDTFPQRSGIGVSGIDFFEVPGVARAADRRDIVLLRSLSTALDLLASPAFADAFNGSTDQSDYRWGRLHRVVMAHPLDGPFNIPPAGGAFPQPLPHLPGIPVDGGLHTVDLGNHQFNRNNSNGFMFAAGPSRRYVASLESDGIQSVSSLPGGQSGVPGSQFYLNLLGRWLTNEAFLLRTDVVDVPDDRDDHEEGRRR